MDAVGELLKRISHDYNNLFGIVIAAMGILEDDIDKHPDGDNLKPLILDALSASREGVELLERLLSCTAFQSLNPETVDVSELLAEIARRFGDVSAATVRVELDREPGLPQVFTDPQGLEKAVLALLDNASESMPSGGKIRISARVENNDQAGDDSETLQPAGRYLGISVSDTGNGIEPHLINRVFEPFFTTKEPTKERGFGLSGAYGFARQSYGGLTLKSEPGRGTTVTLLLPLPGERGNMT